MTTYLVVGHGPLYCALLCLYFIYVYLQLYVKHYVRKWEFSSKIEPLTKEAYNIVKESGKRQLKYSTISAKIKVMIGYYRRKQKESGKASRRR